MMITTLVTFALLLSSALAQPAPAAYYPLTTSANDTSGNGRHATVVGSTGSFGPNGFTATPPTYITIPPFAVDHASFTLEYTWNGGCDEHGWRTIVWSSNIHHPLLINCGSSTVGWYKLDGWYNSGFQLTLGQRYKIAVVMAGTAWSLYIDGSLVLSGTGYLLSENPIVVLGNHGFARQSMYGTLRNVYLFSSPLSASDVAIVTSESSSSSPTPSGTPSPSLSPSQTPFCALSNFHPLPRLELVGMLSSTALLPSEPACRQACCLAGPVCSGYTWDATTALQLPLAACFLLGNVTELAPNILVTSAVLRSSL